MKSLRLALAAYLLCCAAVSAQAAFECYATGPFPLPGPPNCEGVLCNNLGLNGSTGVTGVSACGMPTQGTKYARLEAFGPFACPPGGPPAYPLPNNVTELRIPIPPAAATVQLCWDFYNAEGVGSFLNDGMAIAVLDASGGLKQLLAYADANTPPGTCADTLTYLATEVAPNGPQGLDAALPPFSVGDYLSIACWNGYDNAVASHAKIDDVRFDSGPPSCPVPPPLPPNDSCAGATTISLGANGPWSNAFATTGAVSASCAGSADVNDLWFAFTPVCGGAYAISTCGATFNTTLTVFGSCGGNEIVCNDDDLTATCTGTPLASRVLMFANAGATYLIRVGGNPNGGGTGSFSLNVSQLFLFTFTTVGPGTAGFNITGGPPNGLYFTAVTFNAGSFPNGQFFGIDVGLAELSGLFAAGFPFTGPLGPCGDTNFGPVGGLPSGLSAYGTALGFTGPFYTIPTGASVYPGTITVP